MKFLDGWLSIESSVFFDIFTGRHTGIITIINFQSFNAFRETLTSDILIKFCKVYFM